MREDRLVCISPIALHELVTTADHRMAQTFLVVVEFVAELAFVAGPFLVYIFVGAAVDAHHFADAVIEPNRAAVGAHSADGGLGFEVPRAGAKTIFGVSECSDGAD